MHTQKHPFVDFFICLVVIATAASGVALGYYSSACSSGSSVIGWVLVWLLVLPFYFPAGLLLWPATAFALAVGVSPTGSPRVFAAVAVVGTAFLICAAKLAAILTDATARCSLGF